MVGTEDIEFLCNIPNYGRDGGKTIIRDSVLYRETLYCKISVKLF